MKKIILLGVLLFFLQKVTAQSIISPAEQKITDTICNCLAKVDISKINNKNDAVAVITVCFGKHVDMLMEVAREKHVDPSSTAAMREIGTQIGKDLFNENCAAFTQLSIKMAEGDVAKDEGEGYAEGVFKRIDAKGFNYIVITDKSNNEKSFIWLRQFPGSEKLTSGSARFIGKNIKIEYQEIEVYLPQAKGYYKIKEIKAVEIQ